MLRRGAIAVSAATLALLAMSASDAGAISLSCSISARAGVMDEVDSTGDKTYLVLGSKPDASAIGAEYRVKNPQGTNNSPFGCDFDRSRARTVQVVLGDRDDEVRADGKDFLGTPPFDKFGPLPASIALSVEGGPGDDRIAGHEGSATLHGGDGDDRITDKGGVDEIDGGTGDDRIYAKDGRADLIDCGPGKDVVVADPEDELKHCER